MIDPEDMIKLLEARVANLLILKESLERSLSRRDERIETLELLLTKYDPKQFGVEE
jgi:hypothetical protein